jgi:uncharacterized damage-inducible protein DinB
VLGLFEIEANYDARELNGAQEKTISMPDETAELATIFLNFSRTKLLDQYWPRMKRCVESLSADQLWWRPNSSSNSVGNLLLHLNGNVTQWLVNSFNGEPDLRDRPAEFATTEGPSAAELVAKLEGTLARAAQVLGRLTPAELLAPYTIQGYNVRGLDAVYQVIEHFGLHYGQIVYITKTLLAHDLGFYKELSSTGRLNSAHGKKP